MTWVVVDPKYAMDSNTKVYAFPTPAFVDDIDYESLLESAFNNMPPDVLEEHETWRRVGTLVLAVPSAYEKLMQVMGGDWDVPEVAVRNELARMCLERQAVVLKWMAVQ